MISVDFDTQRFKRDMNELMVVGGLSSSAVVTRASRQVVRNAFRLTPPTGRGGMTQSPGAQKKLGESAVRRDIANRAFPLLSKLKVMQEQNDFSQDIGNLVARGDFKRVADIFERIGFRISGVVARPARGLHNRMRTKGRVSIKVKPYLVAREGNVDPFVKAVQKDVGKAKSGWVRAMIALKLPVPAWVSRHSMPGFFRGVTDKQNPLIEFANQVPYIQEAGREMRIMDYASSHVAAMMPKELERYWADIGRGNGAKVKAKLQRDSFEAFE